MKKNVNILLISFLFLLTSCSNLFNTKSTDYNFSLGTDAANVIQRTVTENTTITDNDIVSVTCLFDGGFKTSQTKKSKLSDIDNVAFSFSGIPLNKKLNITITVSFKDIPLYQGSKKDIIITNPEQTENISVSLEKAQYKITYILGQGTNHKDNPNYYTFNKEAIKLEPASNGDKEFLGWFTTEDFQSDSEVTSIGGKGKIGSVTLYAQWKEENPAPDPTPTEEVKIKYESDFDKLNIPEEKTVSKGYELTSNDLPTLSETGYDFGGWFIGETEASAGSKIDKDIILTAKWSIKNYSITYNGITAQPSDWPTEYNIESEDIELPKPSKTGYDFTSWYDKNAKTTVTSIPKGSVGNKIFEAKWELHNYKITYQNIQKGDTNENPATYTIEETIQLKEPSRTGYTFNGWFTNDKFQKDSKITEITKGSDKDITLYASWEKEVVKADPIIKWSFDPTAPSSSASLQNNHFGPGNDVSLVDICPIYDFCYDNEGYIHIVYYNGYKTTNPNYKEITNSDFYTNIIYDSKTDTIYLLKQVSLGDKNWYIAKLNKNGTTTTQKTINVFNYEANEDPMYADFAIYNNVLYYIFYNPAITGARKAMIILKKFELASDCSISKSLRTTEMVTGGNILSSNIMINDVLIKNGNLYILCADENNNYGVPEDGYSSVPVSRGAIIVAKDDGTNAKTIGWCTGNYPYNKDYVDESTSNTKNEFFNPLKFISIKDNELLIADDGVLDTTNVNRVVTFNTTTNKITNVENLTNTTFDNEYEYKSKQ